MPLSTCTLLLRQGFKDSHGQANRDKDSFQDGNRRRESKWGPPSGNPQGPKSLMDVNFGNKSSNQYGSPVGSNSQPPPWLNQQRGPRPQQGSPANMNNAPWQQGPARGKCVM